MSTLLYYNNFPILSGQPTPLVGREETPIRYGERWAERSTITLHGQITGCTFGELMAAQRYLLDSFTQDFQSFKIVENNNVIYNKPYSFIRSINFPGNSYNNVLSYVVTLDCYEQNLFSGVYGVLEPSDQWNFEETNEGTINASHTISAKGFNTTSGASNAFDNAKNFVLDRTGFGLIVEPYFITTNATGSFRPCLKALAERPDRFNASYAVTETYVADRYFGTDGVLRYTVEFNCGEDGISKVTVAGTIDGCGIEVDTSSLRARYQSLDFYDLANEVYLQAVGGGTLNSEFISRGLTEDPYARKLTFNTTYDNTVGDTYFDYNVNFESGENGVTTVALEGTIKGRGDLASRWQRVQDFYQTVDPYIYALSGYLDFGGQAYPLNPSEISKTVSFNSFQGEISLNYTYDNKDLPWAGFSDLSYSLNYTAPIERIISTPLINKCDLQYYLLDAGYPNRSIFNVDGRGRLDCSDSNALNTAIDSVRFNTASLFLQQSSLINPVLEQNDFTIGPFEVGFKFQWSAIGAAFTLV